MDERPVEQVQVGEMQSHAGAKPVQTVKPKPDGTVERKLYPPQVDAAMAVNAQLLGQEGG